MLHLFKMRCGECGHVHYARMPHRTVLIPAIVRKVPCPRCHPEEQGDLCAACRIPLTVTKPKRRVGRSGYPKHLCNTCAQRERRIAARYKARDAAMLQS